MIMHDMSFTYKYELCFDKVLLLFCDGKGI